MSQHTGQPGSPNPRPFTPGSPAPRPLPTTPRVVRGGIKLAGKEAPRVEHWAAKRLLDIAYAQADDETLAKAFEWGRRGQTRTLTFEPGEIAASVQGLEPRSHRVTLAVSRFTTDQWERIVSALNDSATHSARLLANEMPPEVEEVFAPMGLRLVPLEAGDLHARCACKDPTPNNNGWCIHACVAAMVAAERLSNDPFQVFGLRGLGAEELLERIRQRRAATRSARGFAPAYAPRTPPGVPANAPPLDADLSAFWNDPEGLDEIDTTPRPAEVKHPLLRRLGPSPFTKGKFPLVGLLATCYDIVAEAAVKEADEGDSDNDQNVG
ncbi:MAG: SWIM zinc finger family protein [Phycisphaerales bacterium]